MTAARDTLHGTLRNRGQITLPPAVREALRVEAGDEVVFEVVDNVVVLHAGAWIPRDQAWFWTPEWQAKEREAEDQIRAGKTEFAASAEEMFEKLGGV
jgi:antitoxin PrlF